MSAISFSSLRDWKLELYKITSCALTYLIAKELLYSVVESSRRSFSRMFTISIVIVNVGFWFVCVFLEINFARFRISVSFIVDFYVSTRVPSVQILYRHCR